MRAEQRSAIARARGKRAPQNSVVSSRREWERVLNIYLSSCSTVSASEKGHLIKIAQIAKGRDSNDDFRETMISLVDLIVVLAVLVFCGGGCSVQILRDLARFRLSAQAHFVVRI